MNPSHFFIPLLRGSSRNFCSSKDRSSGTFG